MAAFDDLTGAQKLAEVLRLPMQHSVNQETETGCDDHEDVNARPRRQILYRLLIIGNYRGASSARQHVVEMDQI